MAARKKPGRPKGSTTTRKRTPAKRRTTTTRRRRTTRKGMGDLFTRAETQAGVEQLIGVGAGYVTAEYGGRFLNPQGENDNIEIIGKLAGGFLVSTTGRMPNFGAGIMASGVKKLVEVNATLNDALTSKPLQDRKGDFLHEPSIQPSEYMLNETGEIIYLNDYAPAYQSKMY